MSFNLLLMWRHERVYYTNMMILFQPFHDAIGGDDGVLYGAAFTNHYMVHQYTVVQLGFRT